MSGFEISEEARERDTHACASCMNAVIQTFSYFQEQIRKLRREKANLQEEIKKLRKVGEEQIARSSHGGKVITTHSNWKKREG